MHFERLFGRRIVPHLLALSSFGDLPSEWPYTPPLLYPGEDGPSFPLLFVTLRLPNPWETRQGD